MKTSSDITSIWEAEDVGPTYVWKKTDNDQGNWKKSRVTFDDITGDLSSNVVVSDDTVQGDIDKQNAKSTSMVRKCCYALSQLCISIVSSSKESKGVVSKDESKFPSMRRPTVETWDNIEKVLENVREKHERIWTIKSSPRFSKSRSSWKKKHLWKRRFNADYTLRGMYWTSVPQKANQKWLSQIELDNLSVHEEFYPSGDLSKLNRSTKPRNTMQRWSTNREITGKWYMSNKDFTVHR